jgi:hypothetical protein
METSMSIVLESLPSEQPVQAYVTGVESTLDALHVDDSLNDSKRELSYEDYYGDESVDLNHKKQKTSEASTMPPPLKRHNQNSTSLDTCCAGTNDPTGKSSSSFRERRHAQMAAMLEYASKLAQDAGALSAAESPQPFESEARRRPTRRNSFVVHRKNVTTMFPGMMIESTTILRKHIEASSPKQEFFEQSQNDSTVFLRHASLPCWRKPVVLPTAMEPPVDMCTDGPRAA